MLNLNNGNIGKLLKQFHLSWFLIVLFPPPDFYHFMFTCIDCAYDRLYECG